MPLINLDKLIYAGNPRGMQERTDRVCKRSYAASLMQRMLPRLVLGRVPLRRASPRTSHCSGAIWCKGLKADPCHNLRAKSSRIRIWLTRGSGLSSVA
jgi:hypothetical protein